MVYYLIFLAVGSVLAFMLALKHSRKVTNSLATLNKLTDDLVNAANDLENTIKRP